jgi:Ku protein
VELLAREHRRSFASRTICALSCRHPEKNQFVILADEELREVAPEKSTGIEIQEFVNEAEISSLYFEKPYYLEPDKGAGKAFALLREALMKTGKVGIAQFVLRNRDSLCMLKPHGQGLVLNALRFASEIRSMEELSLPSSEKISPSEVSLAIKLIEGMADSFDPRQRALEINRLPVTPEELTRLKIFQNEDLFAAGPNWDRLSRHHKVLRRY